MKYALFHHVPWPGGQTPAQVFEETTEQVQLAEELGFEAVWFAEHHFSRYGLATSSLMLATHIAAHTSRIRLGTAVTVAPIRHPVHVAEETAMLDVLSNGRLDFGVGSGGTVELDGFGISREESRERMKEVLDMVLGLWTSPVYSHKGAFYEVDGMSLPLRPVQRPHPPVYAAVRNPESVQAAIDRGIGFMVGVLPDTDAAVEQHRGYLEMARKAGKSVDSADVPFFRYVYVGESEEQVRKDTEAQLEWVWSCLEWQVERNQGRGGSLEDWFALGRPPETRYEDFHERCGFFGTPERVLGQLRELRDEHGVAYFGGNFGFGGLDHEKTLRSMKLFAEEVAAQL